MLFLMGSADKIGKDDAENDYRSRIVPLLSVCTSSYIPIRCIVSTNGSRQDLIYSHLNIVTQSSAWRIFIDLEVTYSHGASTLKNGAILQK